MTRSAAAARRVVAVAPDCPPPAGIDWERLALIAALALSVGSPIAVFATMKADVANLRAEIPPGSIQRLEERTEQIQRALERLDDK